MVATNRASPRSLLETRVQLDSGGLFFPANVPSAISRIRLTIHLGHSLHLGGHLSNRETFLWLISRGLLHVEEAERSRGAYRNAALSQAPLAGCIAMQRLRNLWIITPRPQQIRGMRKVRPGARWPCTVTMHETFYFNLFLYSGIKRDWSESIGVEQKFD